MNKYIISNCPAMTDQGECYQGSVLLNTAFQECAERNGCLLKQVVDKIKEAGCKSDELSYTEFKQYFDEDFLPAVNELLDIREILNERSE